MLGDPEALAEYECEGCGKKEMLTQRDAFNQGWDYPPFLGVWGEISPRTCGNCGIHLTAWWQLVTNPDDRLSEKHSNTVLRILAEKEAHGTDAQAPHA